MAMKLPVSRRSAQAGTTLLEVLIAVFIMAIGLLGIAALQSLTLKNTGSSAERSNAIIQSYTMLDVLRADRNAAVSGNYNQGWLCAAANTEDAADANAAANMNQWITQLHQSVGPSACGRITCGQNACEVGVRWDESRATGGTTTPQELVTASRL
jgi:type IV pilus assembly protein PilV